MNKLKFLSFALFLFALVFININQTIAQKKSVSENSPIILDGNLSESEWKCSKKIEMTKGAEAFYKSVEDAVYIGVRGAGAGWTTIYLINGNKIYALHASAALGTAIYKNETAGVWKNTQKFKYEVRDKSMSEKAKKERQTYYKTNDWVATTGSMGKKNEAEFKISRKFAENKKMKIAIVYATETNPIGLQMFPQKLSDDTINIELIKGNTPATLKFDSDSWSVIEF